MTEDDAQSWLRESLGVSDAQFDQLAAFREMVIMESAEQNLISTASIPHFWSRHIVDSAQLLGLAQGHKGDWLDLGTGAGFPGVVLAILSASPITFVESRRRRVEFLSDSVNALGLRNVTIVGKTIERVKPAPFSVITARAFAPLPKLFELAHSFSTEKTLWLLPKGRSAESELESARASWQGMFHVKPSVTDADAAIIVAQSVQKVGKT